MSGGPKNASLDGDGFRFYSWKDPETGEETRVLSVTSIKKLCGENYRLVAWQISNVLNVTLGVTKRTVIGPRGGKKDIYVRDGEFPGAFARQLLATEGKQGGLDALRKWARSAAEEPRDTAAVRGTLVHETIELNVKTDRIDFPYVESAVERLSARDRKKMATKGGVTQEDVDFVTACSRQYWDMRQNVPFVVLAKEPQVWNLTAGYAGSADVLMWFLGEWIRVADDAKGEPVYVFAPLSGVDTAALQKAANAGQITQADIARIGGSVTLGDWKTSAGVYTDQVIQVHAYLAAEFVGADGVIDQRLTDILNAADEAAIIHIRPEGWGVHFVHFEKPVLRAFLGSVALARFLATYPEADPLFTHTISGKAAPPPIETAAA